MCVSMFKVNVCVLMCLFVCLKCGYVSESVRDLNACFAGLIDVFSHAKSCQGR